MSKRNARYVPIKMLTSTKFLFLISNNTGYIRTSREFGLLSFAFLHAGATKTRDPEVFMRIILLRSEIIFQNLISRLKCIFG